MPMFPNLPLLMLFSINKAYSVFNNIAECRSCHPMKAKYNYKNQPSKQRKQKFQKPQLATLL